LTAIIGSMMQFFMINLSQDMASNQGCKSFHRSQIG
jgi:hypothetical protein